MAAIPKPVSNFISLFFGPLYLVLLAAILSQASNLQMVTAVIVVSSGSVVMIALLLTLCSRLAANEPSRKYSVATLMLIMSMLAIYMAFIRQLIVPIDMSAFEYGDYFHVALSASIFMAISTTVLIRFTSSFILLIEIFVRFLSPKSGHN